MSKLTGCPDCESNNVLSHTDIESNKVNLMSHTFVAVFAYETIKANPLVALISVAYLTDKVLSRAWATVR